MNKPIQLSKEEARNLIIQSQYLDKSQSTLDAIKQLGYVQIDTLSVTERAHHHVLYSRNPSYQKEELQQLVKEKKYLNIGVMRQRFYRLNIIGLV